MATQLKDVDPAKTAKFDENLPHLARIQRALKAPKGQYNTFGGYSYRSCEDILEAVKPLLQNCTLLLSDDIIVIGDRYYLKATAKFIDGDTLEETSVSAFAREPIAKKGMDESQITGTASSYARKYALNGLFLIDDTKDADHESNYEGEKKAAPSKPKPAPPQKKPSAPAAPAKPAPKAPEPVPVNPDAPPNPEERITDQQRVALWDIARKAKYSQEQVKEVLAACGYEGTGSIKQKHYIVICEAISGTPVEQIGNIKKQLIALTKEN